MSADNDDESDLTESVLSELGKLSLALRDGGPDVDYRLLYRYLDPTLGATEADRRKVQENVQTWKSWFRAFWELKLEDDLDEAIEDAKSYPKPSEEEAQEIPSLGTRTGITRSETLDDEVTTGPVAQAQGSGKGFSAAPNSELVNVRVTPLERRVWSQRETRSLVIGSLSLAILFLAIGLVWMNASRGNRLDDGIAQLTIYKSGEVRGLEAYPPSEKEPLRKLVATQTLPVPPLFDELSKDIGEKSPGGGPGKTLQSPVGTGVISNRPTFKWNNLSNAVSYRVVIFAANGAEVLSGTSSKSSWTATRDLEWGQSYTWCVYATLTSGERLVTPTSSEPKAKFKVLDEAGCREIKKAQQRFGKSDLYMVLLLTKHGVLDEAERHAKDLLDNNPDSEIAANLMRSFQQLRTGAP